MNCNVSLQVIPNVLEEDLYPVVDKVIIHRVGLNI